MEKLIILSDLWGEKKSAWIEFYTTILKDYFEIKYYDCCDLGEIDLTDYSEENIHRQFMKGGIEKAVENLLKKEESIVSMLGFSIGGSIAWKAACEDLGLKNLIAVSSTRLRHETLRPNGEVKLFYSEEDHYQPKNEWFERFNLKPKIYKNENHNFYMKKEIAEAICRDILNKEFF